MAHDYSGINAAIIASTIPRGTLQSIQFPLLPEGYYSITYKDIPGQNIITVFDDSMPLLCGGTITYKGEPLAAICGPDKQKVVSLCRQTRVTYDTDYSLLGFNGYTEEQVIAEKSFVKGNAEKVLNDADRTVEGTYRIDSQPAGFIGSQGITAAFSKGILTIEGETQWPFQLRRCAAVVCNLPVKDVHVGIGNFNPTYDEKLVIPLIYGSLAALLAFKSGKAVKFTYGEGEKCSLYPVVRPETVITRRSAVDEKGKVLAEKVDIDVNMGAYPLFTDELLSQVLIGAAGSYTIPNIKITCRGIVTSAPPMNVFKGLSYSSGTFSAETHFSRIAELYGKNPGEWRLTYLPGKKPYLPTGGIVKDFHGQTLLEKLLDMSDFNRKYAAYEILRKNKNQSRLGRENIRGIGLAFGFTGNGPTVKRDRKETYSVKVKLDRNDTVTILSSAYGSQSTAIWVETAAAILGMEPSSVIIQKGDTATLPNSGPSFLSGGIGIVTSLVEKCCLDIKKQRFHHALPIMVKRSYRSPGTKRWDPEKFKGIPFHSLSWGAAAVEIEIDPIFLRVMVRGIWLIIDSGRMYNKRLASDTLETAIFDTLAEILPKEDLTLPSTLDTGFNVPAARHLPAISIEIDATRKAMAGGISRIPGSLLPSALVSAVTQATGIYFDRIPLTPEILHAHMEES